MKQWLEIHEEMLFDALSENLIFFGEWCAVKHSLDYSRLPVWWLMFHVYDKKEGRFWSVDRRNHLAGKLRLSTMPVIERGLMDKNRLIHLACTRGSSFREGQLEGLIIRQDDASRNRQRAKLVRRGFVRQINEHWRSRIAEQNRLARVHTD